MQKISSTSPTITSTANTNRWSLPPPNSYTFSLVISTCARCNQATLALSLLNQMEENISSSKEDLLTNNNPSVVPNTWVYNAAMAACVESTTADSTALSTARSKISKGAHLTTAFDILHKMESNCNNNALPDTVSYNTILSLLDESSFMAVKESLEVKPDMEDYSDNRLSRYNHISEVVLDILDTMEARGIACDSITYYNAIMACGSSSRSSDNALAILRRSCANLQFMISETTSNGTSGKKLMQLNGRAATGSVFVVNAALSVAAKTGDVQLVPQVLSLMDNTNGKLNAESIKHIIRTLGKVADCEAILALLICLRGQNFANDILKTRYSIDILSHISEDSLPLIEEGVYSAAITSCL